MHLNKFLLGSYMEDFRKEQEEKNTKILREAKVLYMRGDLKIYKQEIGTCAICKRRAEYIAGSRCLSLDFCGVVVKELLQMKETWFLTVLIMKKFVVRDVGMVIGNKLYYVWMNTLPLCPKIASAHVLEKFKALSEYRIQNCQK